MRPCASTRDDQFSKHVGAIPLCGLDDQTLNHVDVNVNCLLISEAINIGLMPITRGRLPMSLDAIAEKIRERVAGSGFDKSVKFDLGEDGVIVVDGASVTTEDAGADCTITISKENFLALTAGELNPTMAFMTGKIKVAGDMSIAMQLSQIL
jgi:putative sterol carrier protein